MNQPDPTPSSAPDAEIEAAVGSLNLDRTVRLLTGASMFALHGEPSIGLAPMVFSDGPTGVRGPEFAGGREVTLLPNATLLASGWDEGSAERAGRLLAEEALAHGVQVVLGPTINLHRTPLHGRLFEAYSEDPLLTGRLAAAYVRGLQGFGVGACPKHFLANEAETLRHTVDSRLGARALRELYLMPFQICVEDSHPWTIMAAYNDVNGVAATEHDELLNGVLKGEWDWDGLVMSDWFATKTTAASANGGLDLVMPGPDGPWGGALIAAVTRGEVPVATVRDHLRRLLRLAGRLGAFGTAFGAASDTAGSSEAPAPPAVDPLDPARRSVLRALAAAGMTVLTNAGQTLPIDPNIATADTPLLVVGRHALRTLTQGGGSAKVRPQHEVSIAEGLQSALPIGLVRVVDGVEVRQRCQPADPGFVRDPETGAPGIRVTSRRADGTVLASEAVGVAEAVVGIYSTRHAGASTVELAAELALTDRASVEVGVLGDGRWTLDIDGRSKLLPPPDGRDAVVSGVFDQPSRTTTTTLGPGSRLRAHLDTSTLSLPLAIVGLVARPAPAPDDEILAGAVEAARDAPFAVVVVGLTTEQETEEKDKQTLALPGAQDRMVSAIAAAARRTVVVVNAATPILMPWLDDVDAVLWVGLPGQEAGHAVTDVLLGRREATGRLVTTFPNADGEGPAWSPVPVDGVLEYREGVEVGYRGWYGGSKRPLFWFGHGLGWTSWAYPEARHVVRDGTELVEVDVQNTGGRTGREVVQVYLRPDDEPVRLVGWAAADGVAPGERRTVTVPLDNRAMRIWDEAGAGWRDLPGGRLLIARGLGDVRLTVPRRGGTG